jgi:hypothetical protein
MSIADRFTVETPKTGKAFKDRQTFRLFPFSMSVFALFSLILSFGLAKVEACLPNGICGANPFCGGGLLPPIPPVSLNQPLCGQGMMRGPYGCYTQRRVHASTIYKPQKRSNLTAYRLADSLSLIIFI